MSSRRSLAFSLSALLVFLFTLLPSSLLSAAPADDLLRLHQLRLAAQKSLGDFYMYNGMEGDQRYARMIGESLQEGQARLDSLGEMPGDASKALRAQLQTSWQSYRSGLQALMDAMRKQGYTDLQPVADLADHNQRLMAISQELYQKIQQESGFSVPPLTQKSREQSLLMQNIALDYASRSASVGTSFFGGGEERAMDVLVGDFASKLGSLSAAQQNTPQITAALSAIETKWRYIEKSLRNYNENTVPFLVSKYSDSIIEGLEGVSAQYAANQQ
ncbi:hypothetical protein [Ectopseudomonas guguanensis]|jgi:hypothetical protein|uniref:Type IV pili methyl-accepting chemotaxis transducer N-term n=1 Tax=Ectopseudomonas guguanensis TaxID=1198456 RepID=A0A1H0KCK1_9GAMM|nr:MULTISPECIES: hypothetical protein [Pseudomonas]ATH81527.1 hypothetical protein CO724_10265 [Pseudomonas mendocina]MPT18201.1 hypothetical protein [Pseudomonas sp.]WJH56233.1 hypothetical protein FE254_08635 [Pseudomonas guguanensis]SDO53647.1 hypothetical protein SAMN05216213_101255 [Pseudomonas guguanensis]